VQSVNKGTDSWVLVFLPPLPGDITVILMLGGTQAASSVMFKNGSGAFDGETGIAFARHLEVSIVMARMNPNMVENVIFRRWYALVVRPFEKKLRLSVAITLLIDQGNSTVDPLFILILAAPRYLETRCHQSITSE
jgi:hypothetical protein